MKTILVIFILGSFSFAFATGLQDSTQNREQNQIEVQEQNQQKNQGDENQIRDRNRLHSGNQLQEDGSKKRGKDVFIDKDGDGIADTRAGGMSLNKIRKRTRTGGHGSGHGGSGGSGGKGGGQ